MSAPRPLPSRPSLEFERKEAKALLRQLRAGHRESLARAIAQHPGIDAVDPTRSKLADAQLVIAREYGFASWPKLVRYFRDVERQPRIRFVQPRSLYEGMARSLLVEHRDRRAWTARLLAAYVPRLYGRPIEEIFDASITEDEARLAMARTEGFSSWQTLLEQEEKLNREFRHPSPDNPFSRAARAVAALDIDALARVIEEHPELLRPSNATEVPTPPSDGAASSRNLAAVVIEAECHRGKAVRPVADFVEERGLDLRLELNMRLCGGMGMQPETVRWLLDRGADPNWVGPNGIPVLEHALLRYMNGDAVDVLAERARPRKALWIAAGLGLVDEVAGFLDKRGKPTRAARERRPDVNAIGSHRLIPQHPDPTDEQLLLEAFFVAMINGRTGVLEHMVSRGFDLNTRLWDTPMVNWAVGQAIALGGQWVRVAKCLIRCGADLDLKGWRPHMTAREMAREMFGSMPVTEEGRRIVELCGLDADAILAERAARPPAAPVMSESFRRLHDLAADDASRVGHTEVGAENLLYAVLRQGYNPFMVVVHKSGADAKTLLAEVDTRIEPGDESSGAKLPLTAEAQAILDAALALATESKNESVHGMHVLVVLARDEQGPLAALLQRHGGSAGAVIEAALATL